MSKKAKTPKEPSAKDVILEYFPSATDEDVSNLLWSGTAFPFVEVEKVREQLQDLADRSGNDAKKALDLAEEDTDKAMRSIKRSKR